jgi:AraC-like DNA-binding protein
LTNQSPTLMIRSIRLQRAAELLARKTGSVAEIAYFVGFSSQAYFAKCFREQFGCSPREYAPSVSASPVQANLAVDTTRPDVPASTPRSPSRPWPVRRRA